MKTTISAFVTSLFLVSCINVKSDADSFGGIFSGKKGTGSITEKTVSGDFNSIEVATSITAEVYKADTEKVLVSAPSDILEFIKVDNNGGKLKVYIDSHFPNNISTERVNVKIYAKDFDELKTNSSGEIILKDTFSQDKVSVDISSSGEVKGNLEANNLAISVSSSGNFSGKVWADKADFTVSSSGDFDVEGKVQHGKIEANSSGDFNGNSLEVKEGEFDASSSGSIFAMVSKTASAHASSSGDITLKKLGNPVISKSESSSGSVTIN